MLEQTVTQMNMYYVGFGQNFSAKIHSLHQIFYLPPEDSGVA